MKIFSWMQSKLNRKQAIITPNTKSAATHHKQEAPREEFSDWPNELLAIGTFGNNDLKDPGKTNHKGILSPCQNQTDDIFLDGAGELDKDLKILPQKNYDSVETSEEYNLQVEEVSACLQSLQDDKSTNDKEGHLPRSTNLASRRGKDISLDKTNIGIQKKSLTFLLKKTFACASGFTPTPVLKDPFTELKLERSVMEKIMQSILHKKIYPQGSSPRPTGKKYLGNKIVTETDCKDELSEMAGEGSKWVKTDSEYIVLEI